MLSSKDSSLVISIISKLSIISKFIKQSLFDEKTLFADYCLLL